MRTLLLVPAILLAPLVGAGSEPPVRLTRVHEILNAARPELVRLTGLAWPPHLVVEKTDRAGLEKVLLQEFRLQLRALHPERPSSSRRILARVLAHSFARIVKAKYGFETKKIYVLPGTLSGLPKGVKPDLALTLITVHEAVHAMDDYAVDLGKEIAAAKNPEALRALRMIIEGRAEFYSQKVAADLGVPRSVAVALSARRSPGERLTRDAGRRFIAALFKKDPKLPLEALKHPPKTTSVVFHPDRYGKKHEGPALRPLLGRLLHGAKPRVLSELLLRERFGRKLSPKKVAAAFEGFVNGAQASKSDGTRLSLVLLEDGRAAKAFFGALLAFEGIEHEGKNARSAHEEIYGPGGTPYSWAAEVRGRFVAESVLPGKGKSGALAASALEAATKEAGKK